MQALDGNDLVVLGVALTFEVRVERAEPMRTSSLTLDDDATTRSVTHDVNRSDDT